jgi:ABC-type glutathione transport system ATPase component
MTRSPLLIAGALVKAFPLPRAGLRGRRQWVTAVDHVSLDVMEGEVLALVGESGSGKSTLARLLVALESPDSGEIVYRGDSVVERGERALRGFRREVQIVLQNPFSSLDPRLRVGSSIIEPLRALAVDCDRPARMREVLAAVGLPESAASRYPHQFSGGQRQRIAIARALAPRPRLLIADEPVSALDVSVQAQILNLLQDLVQDFGVTLVLVSHDLGVVRHLADRVAVMNQGRIVESAPTAELFEAPGDPYTRRLLGSMLSLTTSARSVI